MCAYDAENVLLDLCKHFISHVTLILGLLFGITRVKWV